MPSRRHRPARPRLVCHSDRIKIFIPLDLVIEEVADTAQVQAANVIEMRHWLTHVRMGQQQMKRAA